MEIDEKEFFREATIRICGSLNIKTAVLQCFDYIKSVIPMTHLLLSLHDPERRLLKAVVVIKNGKIMDNEATIPISTEMNNKILSYIGRKESAESTQFDGFVKEISVDVAHKFSWGPKRLETALLRLMLRVEGKFMGGLTVFEQGRTQYSQEHSKLLSLLNEPFSIALSNAMMFEEVVRYKNILEDDKVYLSQELLRISGDKIIGAESCLKTVMNQVRQVAELDTPVLLLGETGVGKELIANAIHYSSPRKNGPYIKVNCGAVVETLLDSELFGHERGSFTGALTQKRGRFERAHQGTIFLDEIGELPYASQVKLLRVLQEKEIERVGGTSLIPLDIRVIAATHRSLEDMVAKKEFRKDLFFRINVFPIIVPPLRGRKGDMPELVDYLISKKSLELKLAKAPVISAGGMQRLMAYDWPGNVRELENTIERELIQTRGEGQDRPIWFESLGSGEPATDNQKPFSMKTEVLSLDEVNAAHIRRVLEMTHGKIFGPDGAAAILKINPNTLRARIKKLNIQK